MKILVQKIDLLVLVLVSCFYLINSQPTAELIPIPESLVFGPKTHERLVVQPVDEFKKAQVYKSSNETVKNESSEPTKVQNVAESPRRSVIHNRGPPLNRQPRIIVHDSRRPEKQPLHIDTEVFDKSKPNHTLESVEEKRKRFKVQEERIKMKELPPNPKSVPMTTWFDNLAKYNYGVIHSYSNLEEIPTLEEIDANEGESKEVLKPVQSPPPSQQIATTPSPAIKFRSSFRDPNIYAQIHDHQNDNMGKFLYKTQVYYPNYRDHLYLPVTTFYGDNRDLVKEFPVYNAHTIYHGEPAVINLNNNNNVPQDKQLTHPSPPTSNVPLPPVKKVDRGPPRKKQHPTVAPKKVPPKTVHNPKKEVPRGKPAIQPRKPLTTTTTPPPPPPPPKKKEPTPKQAEEEEDYDYEEEGDDDYEDDDGPSNDKYNGDDYEEEEESSSEEKETVKNKKAYKHRNNDDESDEDQFDKTWGKFGYGKQKSESDESDSYESSESQSQPERIKIVHMKMEVQTTPMKDDEILHFDDADEEESERHEVQPTEKEEKKKNKGGVKNQAAQHPNAGPDDLKFFQ